MVLHGKGDVLDTDARGYGYEDRHATHRGATHHEGGGRCNGLREKDDDRYGCGGDCGISYDCAPPQKAVRQRQPKQRQ